MASFVWRDRLKVSVWEINRAKALRVAQTVNNLIAVSSDSSGFITTEIDAAYVLNAPCRVSWDGELLTDGEHTLTLDDQEISLVLPMTRECFDSLPVSLTASWIDAALSENSWLSDFFVNALRKIVPNGAPQSEGLQS